MNFRQISQATGRTRQKIDTLWIYEPCPLGSFLPFSAPSLVQPLFFLISISHCLTRVQTAQGVQPGGVDWFPRLALGG